MNFKKSMVALMIAALILPSIRLRASSSRLDSEAEAPGDERASSKAPAPAAADADEDIDSSGDAAPSKSVDDDEAPRPKKKARRSRTSSRRSSRATKEHKVLVGLVVPSAIVAVLGLVLTVDGFRSNPAPNGSTSLTWSSFYSGGWYTDAYGTYTNTGKGGVYPTINLSVQNSVGVTYNTYSYSTYTDVGEGGTESWYYYNHYVGGTAPYYMKASTTQLADGGYAVNNAYEGIAGVVCLALGITGTIIGLTHTEEVMAQNGVQLKLAQADNDKVVLAASKSF